VPENFIYENYSNLGEIGDPTEPLFQAAINQILGLRRRTVNNNIELNTISDSNLGNPFYLNMYVDLK